MSAQPVAPPANPAVAQLAPVLLLAPAPPIFALGPGCNNTFLDYSNTSHIKMSYKAIVPLETKYGGKPSSLCIFMNSVLNMAKNYGWSNILNITTSVGPTRTYSMNMVK